MKNTRNRNRILKIILPVIAFLPLVFGIASCSPIDSNNIINSLLPNLWVFLSHIFAATVLLIIIIWLVWKPTKTTLAKRHDYIANEIKEAEKARLEAQKELCFINKAKIEAHSKANEIIENAQKESFKIKEVSKIKAKKLAEQIKIDAKNQILLEQKEINDNINKKIIDIAFEAAEQILKTNIDKSNHDEYINNLLQDIEKDFNK